MPEKRYNYYVGRGPKNNWATAQYAGDRLLSVGWVPAAPHSALSAVRDVRYDHRVDRLVALPVAEYVDLRNGTLVNTTVRVAGAPVTLDATRGLAASAADVVVAVRVGPAAVNVSMTVLGGRVRLSVALAAAPKSPGLRSGSATVATVGGEKRSSASSDVALLATETVLDVRVLVDRAVAEFFVAGGRAVFTEIADYADTAVTLAATPAVDADVAVFSMGCGWNATAYNDRP